MRVRNGPIRPSSLGLSPLPGTWVMVVIALISISATGVAAITPETDEASQFSVAEVLDESSVDASQSSNASSSTTVSEASPIVAGNDSPPRPDGQTDPDDVVVNHGQVVNQAGDLSDGTNRGCVTRRLAKSDLGKKNAESDPDGPMLDADGAVDPDSVDLECANGKNDASAENDDADEKSPGKDEKSDGSPATDKGEPDDDPKTKPGKGEGRDKSSG